MARVPFKVSPWMIAAQAAMLARDRWRTLEPQERQELGRLVRKFRGRPSDFTPEEKERIKVLASRLDFKGAAIELLPVPGAKRIAQRRRRHR